MKKKSERYCDMCGGSVKAMEPVSMEFKEETTKDEAGGVGSDELGSLSARYESGGRDDAISSGKGDKGGVSYGRYQLSSNMGTLQTFLKQSGYDKDFAGFNPATSEFNAKWKQMAKDPNFNKAQHDFIKRTHYDPVAKRAQELGIDVSNPAIANVLWSMGVQHAGAKTIVERAVAGKNPSSMSPQEIIRALYDARRKYVARIGDMNPSTKKSLMARYDNEERQALAMASSAVPTMA